MSKIKNAMEAVQEIMIKALDNYSDSVIVDYVMTYASSEAIDRLNKNQFLYVNEIFGDDTATFMEIYNEFSTYADDKKLCELACCDTVDEILDEVFYNNSEFFDDFHFALYEKLVNLIEYYQLCL